MSFRSLSPATPFPQLASLLRASCPAKLDSPDVYTEALSLLESMFPDEPVPHFEHPHLEDAAILSRELGIKSVRTSQLLQTS
jgi:hypothetical protein